MEILGALYIRFNPDQVAEILRSYVERDMNLSVKDLGWNVSEHFFFQVDLNAEPKPARCKPENEPAAKPVQPAASQQDDLPTDTPEKQEEGLRNDSAKKSLDVDGIQRELYKKMPEENKAIWEKKHEASLNGKVKTPLTERILAVITEAGWATSKYIQDQLDEDFSKVPKLLWQLDKKGQIQKRHVPTKYGKRYEYSLAGYKGKSDLEPEPPTLSPNAQTVLDTLKEFDCLTFYTKICEAVDLPEIEVTKAIRELKVAKRISSPKEKPMHYQVVS